MKILLVNTVSGISSTGRICTDLADAMIKQGHEVKIAYGRNPVPPKYQSISHRIGNDLDFKAHALISRIFDNSGLNSRIVTKEFIKWIKEYEPDVIHLHNIHGYYINYELFFDFLKDYNRPVVWTFHDCWPFTGHCTYFDFDACYKWHEGNCENCAHKNKYPKSLLLNNSKKNWNIKKQSFCGVKNLTIVTPSKWLADYVKQSFLSGYDVLTFYNGIDTDVFKPINNDDFRKKYNLQDKKIVLGVADGWTSRKGFKDFIDLSKMLSDSYKIVLIGVTEDNKKELPDNIIGINRTNNVEELVEIYSTADVFLNLTYEDNYPTTNLEAQACGTPCITYDTGGSVESVDKRFVVKKKDFETLISIISNIDNNDYTYNNRLSKSYMISEYLDLYNKLRD